MGIESARVERGAKAKLGEAVWAFACEEHCDFAALYQRRRPFGDRLCVGRRFAELDVELVKESGEGVRVADTRQPDSRVLVLGAFASRHRRGATCRSGRSQIPS
jgi:hypothetical protein